MRFFWHILRPAAAELFEHVVNAGEREVGILLLLPLAVRIESLAEIADALLAPGKGKSHTNGFSWMVSTTENHQVSVFSSELRRIRWPSKIAKSLFMVGGMVRCRPWESGIDREGLTLAE